MGRRVVKACMFLFGCLVMIPDVTLAQQSAIVGLVSDSTGSVLPGVSVEAASPVLIEGRRVAVTDGAGRYQITELRPGTFQVTFTLTGFGTVIREGLELPANFTATVNAELRVGDIAESVTVSGASPVVDIKSTGRQQVMSREMMDEIPSGGDIPARARMIPAVRLSAVVVGSARSVQATYMAAFGANDEQTTLNINGLNTMSMEGDGGNQGYFNEQGYSSVSFETTSAGAEASKGGVRVNMIPKEGGNVFRGDTYFGGTQESWQSNNFDAALQALGISTGQRFPLMMDFHVSQGGPIIQDKLWFFGSYRKWITNVVIPGAFYRDGRRGIDDGYVHSGLMRLTWQVDPKHKIVAHLDRAQKRRPHEMSVGWDIETASIDRSYALLGNGQIRYTMTNSSRLMLEAAYAPSWNSKNSPYQPGIREPRGTPGWFAKATRLDRQTSDRWAAAPNEYTRWTSKPVWKVALSYVTGSLSFRAGVENTSGISTQTYDLNADLQQEYRNGIPESVLIWNSPIIGTERLNYDRGVFAQDTWTIDRLTVNAGVRADFFNAQVVGEVAPGGRFVPERRFSDIENLPDQFDVSPRFGLTYDLFGNAKTALKFSVNRYMDGDTTAFTNMYNPMDNITARIPWRDLNRDDIAQEGEFDVNLLPTNFGARALNTPDPDIERRWNLMVMTGLDHELFPGTAVGAAWVRRTQHDMSQRDNLLLDLSAYHPVTVINPINGLPITVYDLNDSLLLARVDNFDTNAVTPPPGHPFAGLDRSETYNGIDLTINSRFPGGAVVFGGWTFERTRTVNCVSPDDPNTFRFCNRIGLDRESGIQINMPFQHFAKVSANLPLPFGFRASGSVQSYAGNEESINWNITANTRYPSTTTELSRLDLPGVCTGCEDRAGQRVIPNMQAASITVRLDAPGERYRRRINMVDLGVGKTFDLPRRTKLQLMADVFNVLNVNTVNASNTTFGSSYGRPNTFVDARYLNLGAKLEW